MGFRDPAICEAFTSGVASLFIKVFAILGGIQILIICYISVALKIYVQENRTEGTNSLIG